MFNKLKLSGINLLLAVLLFSGCGPKVDIIPNEPEEWPLGQNVYVAGFENVTQDNPIARLWKNGEMQNLAGSSGNILRSSSAVISSEARSIFVSGNDVYVAGHEVIVSGDNWYMSGNEVATNGDEVTAKARLWKNGEMQALVNGNFSDLALSVFVSGDDVYVLGSESLQPVRTASNKYAYKYWKNGEAEIFAEGNSYKGVNSIFVSNNDVYIVGGYDNQAKLWKNGMEENLAGGMYANSVFVSGSDVYVAGYSEYNYVGEDNGITIANDAQVWKNGRMEKLTNSPQNSNAFSVYVSENDDLYVAGHDGDEAKLWKNGEVQEIADDEDARIYHSVFIKENDVYLAGFVETVEPVEGGLMIVYLKATLWKNGKKLKLNTERNTGNSWAFSVFVK